MTKETFQKQIERLQANYRETDYKEERVALFWRALEKTDDHVFTEAIDELIANKRSSPMLQEISEAVDEARRRDAERRAIWARDDAAKRGRGGIMGVLEDLADRESLGGFARDCIAMLKDKIDRKLPADSDEWQGKLALLDEAARQMPGK